MPKVSIIVPIYKVEEYIEYCARSLFEQTLDDLEYIFIDDCSPDKSIERLEAILEKYPQRRRGTIILHNKKNLGQAETRKRGILLAKGDYIIHCDPDDWVEKDMYETLYTAAVESKADIVMCDFFRNFSNGCESVMNMADDTERVSAFINFYTAKRMGTLSGHLVSRKIVQNESIIWPKWNFTEDLTLVFQYFMLSKKNVSVKKALYHYRENLDSISNQSHGDGYLKTHMLIESWFKEMNLCNDIRPYRLAKRFGLKAQKLGESKGSDWDAQRAWLETEPDLGILELLEADLSIKQKIYAVILFVRLMPFINIFVDIRHRIWSV